MTFAFDDSRFRVVQKPVKDSGCECAVVVEDFRPVLKRLVGGEDHRAAFIAMADDLKKKVRACFVYGKISYFVNKC